jgi:hypothetical protein
VADTAASSNWAGYAAHRSGVSFGKVTASWRQPSVSCIRGAQTFSAYWVGIGGFSPSSSALEQIGTEADCDASGRPVLSAWYELVPAPSTPISFTLSAGDEIDATVTVKGHRVRVSLYDATRHHGFTKTLATRNIDTSSAEWIVEAPSVCNGGSSCHTLPLADFGAAVFQGAGAQTTGGRKGTISNAAWGTTKINLLPGGRQFVAFPDSGPASGSASTSALQGRGSEFKVTYAGASPSMSARAPRAVAPRAPVTGRLVHPVAERR